jgi:hypothetical protein
MSFTWLPLSDRKNITPPTLIIKDYNYEPYCGWYAPDTNTVGILYMDDDQLKSTLAHEFRHCIQRQLGWWKDCKPNDPRISITEYFRTSVMEFDALLYEYKHAKNDTNHSWLKELVDPTSRHS